MLVLSRQRDQAIVIGDDIEVSVVDIRGDKVRIGINAPRSVSVHRKEIYEAIRKENAQAAELQPEDVSPLVASPNQPPKMKLAADNVACNGDPFLRIAVEEARKSLGHGGIPNGAVLVRENKIIGRGHDRRVQRRDPMALAEIDCLASAGQQKTYGDTVLYTTLMPSFVSAGAILQFGVPRLIVGDTVNFAGGSCKIAKGTQLLADCGVELIDLHDAHCIEMMAKFIAEKGEVWKEMTGS